MSVLGVHGCLLRDLTEEEAQHFQASMPAIPCNLSASIFAIPMHGKSFQRPTALLLLLPVAPACDCQSAITSAKMRKRDLGVRACRYSATNTLFYAAKSALDAKKFGKTSKKLREFLIRQKRTRFKPSDQNGLRNFCETKK